MAADSGKAGMISFAELVRLSIRDLNDDSLLKDCSITEVDDDNCELTCGNIVVKINIDPRVPVISSDFLLNRLSPSLDECYPTNIVIRFYGDHAENYRRSSAEVEEKVLSELKKINAGLESISGASVSSLHHLHHFMLGYAAGYTDTLNRTV